ncbi:MAG: YkvA family protein [Candidatus Nanopelagicales bacterium]
MGKLHESHPDQVEDGAFWRKVRAVAGRVPFVPEVVAAYFAMRDRSTPWRHKAVLAGAIAYFILPVDAIPDFILPMGFADDAAAIAAALAAARMSIHDVHRSQARRALGLVAPADVYPGQVHREG